MAKLHVVALGSSFAAGPGIPPQVDPKAMRSGNNYAHLLAAHLGARLTDLTVSGATLNTILKEPQVFFGTTFPPQLSLLPADADIVTVTAGGNDLNYIGDMMHDCVKAYTVGRLVLRFLPARVPVEALDSQAVADRLVSVVDQIRSTAPRARILLVEYLALLGDHTTACVDVPFSQDRVEHHRGVAESLQRAYSLAGEARPESCEVVSMDSSLEHCLGSAEPWVDGCNLSVLYARKTPLHPNTKGMQAVADVLYKRLRDVPRAENPK